MGSAPWIATRSVAGVNVGRQAKFELGGLDALKSTEIKGHDAPSFHEDEGGASRPHAGREKPPSWWEHARRQTGELHAGCFRTPTRSPAEAGHFGIAASSKRR
ncbi:hypothetical protein TSO5_28120 [Azospirillum sp. TSO5]|nr:hypothetical protein TSO5_28120 [Azospirillum sp. TSO5]